MNTIESPRITQTDKKALNENMDIAVAKKQYWK
jgi:hypothetical protein